ncbi:lyase family protein [Candidatus Synechococcus spongiarum]|uniref:lyase family protein n=1 Tax=Candidatus Synechococcus spongiarum TaxID=431041 RepID=UPI0009B86116|nr:lyase family protein [Candidatus Synechococcus spongiarum]
MDRIGQLAMGLHKIVNDIRLLASGPRAGFGELRLPANEPGSSIMSGKVNPTQCEAVAMATVQVLGQSNAVTMAGCGGHLQMNVYKPLLLAPEIGYDAAARVALHAHAHQLSLRDAALTLGVITAERFDQVVNPRAMAHPYGE